MAQIGTFTRNEDGSFAGTIKTGPSSCAGLWLSHRFVPKNAHALVRAMLASPACLAGQGCSATFVPARRSAGSGGVFEKETEKDREESPVCKPSL